EDLEEAVHALVGLVDLFKRVKTRDRRFPRTILAPGDLQNRLDRRLVGPHLQAVRGADDDMRILVLGKIDETPARGIAFDAAKDAREVEAGAGALVLLGLADDDVDGLR